MTKEIINKNYYFFTSSIANNFAKSATRFSSANDPTSGIDASNINLQQANKRKWLTKTKTNIKTEKKTVSLRELFINNFPCLDKIISSWFQLFINLIA